MNILIFQNLYLELISGFLTDKIGLIQGFAFAAKDIVCNIIQVATGIVVALIVSPIIIKAKQSIFAN